MKKDVRIRTIILAIALINQVLSAFGKSIIPIDDETVTQLISAIFTVCTSVWAWWKNNSITPDAIAADEFLKELRGK